MFELEQALSISGGTPPTFKVALFAMIAALILSQIIAATLKARPASLARCA